HVDQNEVASQDLVQSQQVGLSERREEETVNHKGIQFSVHVTTIPLSCTGRGNGLSLDSELGGSNSVSVVDVGSSKEVTRIPSSSSKQNDWMFSRQHSRRQTRTRSGH